MQIANISYKSLFLFLLVFAIPACAPVGASEPITPSQPAAPDSSNEVDIQSPFLPTQTVIIEPPTIEPATDETRESGTDNQMPVFLEMIQTTIMGENPGQGPSLGVGPNIYFYNPDSQVLALNQAIVLEQSTELLIGVETILQTPDQEYTKREIVQYPSMQPALIQIVAFDAETGTITILYESEMFDLTVGEGRTYKQVAKTDVPRVITVFSNHGQLAEVQSVSSDGSWR